MKKFFLPVFLLLVCYAGCKDAPVPVTPVDCDALPCDTCNTFAPISGWDSLYNKPDAKYMISKVVFNQHRNELIGHVKKSWSPHFSGVFIHNILTKETTILNAWDFALFSSGDRMLVAFSGWNGIGIYEFELKEYRKITSIPDQFVRPILSIDESYIIADSSHTPYRISLDGLQRVVMSDSLIRPQQLDEKTIIGLHRFTKPREGVLIMDLETKAHKWMDFTGLPADMNWGFAEFTFVLSPDRTRILMDVASSRGIWVRENGGLFLLDIASQTARKVLPQQYWGQPWYATWSSNSTFFASYHCRKDTTAMLFEYDLNGKVLRQVTFKEMKLYP